MRSHVLGRDELLETEAAGTSRTSARAGLTVSAIGSLFLLFDGAVKLLNVPGVVEANTRLGYTASVVLPLGVLEMVLLVIYLVPQTAIVGAILWTGYLGGAIATHVRAGSSAFETTFPLLVAALLWGGLWLRDARVHALVAGER